MTKSYTYYTLDVFTKEMFGGNPLAVFPEAEGLTSYQMQQIAREFNLSETVFVLPPENPQCTHKLRIFTPKTELPFAGHPTLGTAYLLGKLSPTSSLILEEEIGPIEVKINLEEDYTELASSKTPEYGKETLDKGEIAQILSLEVTDIQDLAAISCGVPFLFITIKSLEAISKARVNLPLWGRILSSSWSPHLYLLTRETIAEEVDIHARMFAPGLGIEEDPATGSGATALAAYLTRDNPIIEGTLAWQIEQGMEMGRPSLLKTTVDFKNSQIQTIRVGGNSVLVTQGQFFL